MNKLIYSLIVLLVLTALPASAITRIEGEYQLQLDIRRQDRAFPWDFESNNDDTWAASQLRIFTTPRNGVEAFVKLEADWNTGANNNSRPVYQYRESHLRFWKEFKGAEAEARLFSRQDRFWVEKNLLELVKSDIAKDGDNAQGARFDLKHYRNTDITYIISDFSGQSKVGGNVAPPPSDDAHIFRLRHSFFDNNMKAGMTYARKMEGQENESGFNEVYGVDFRFSFLNSDLFIDYADSRIAGPDEKEDGSWDFDFGHITDSEFNSMLPNDAAFKAEFRSIRFGNPTFGYYNIAPQYYYFGRDYGAWLGDSTNDLVGYKINTWYLIPGRAITMTIDWEENRKSTFENKKWERLRAEIYTEYVNGFTSKIWYDRQKTTDYGNPLFDEETKNYDFFAEVQVESRLAWMRVQGKIKDLETARRKELVSLESAVNLNSRLKVYSRYAFGNDPHRLRKGLFSELQYRPRDQVEIFLSYGPWWIGDDAVPVNDGDLAGSANNKDIIRLIVKGIF